MVKAYAPIEPAERLVWTVPEAATLLGVSPSTVVRLIREGRIPVIRGTGRRTLIAKTALARFADDEGAA